MGRLAFRARVAAVSVLWVMAPGAAYGQDPEPAPAQDPESPPAQDPESPPAQDPESPPAQELEPPPPQFADAPPTDFPGAPPPRFPETPRAGRPLVPFEGGYALEGSARKLSTAELWHVLGKPEEIERFRRQRIGAGVSMAPGIALAAVGIVWLILVAGPGCTSFGDDDGVDDSEDDRCLVPTTRPSIAAFGMTFGGILLTAPGAAWMDKERRVLAREVEAYNRNRSGLSLARPQIRLGRPRALGLGLDVRLRWRF